MGIGVSQAQMDRLASHANELLRWNRKTNLTAITAPEELAIKHIIDSMAVIPEIPVNASLLDIGSGGGFPGIVIKILRPDVSVTMIDAARKKISFLSHLIRMLDLPNATARHVRAETLNKDPSFVHAFGVIVCRALCDLYSFVTMAMPLMAPRGKLVAFKGRRIETETELSRFQSCSRQNTRREILLNDQILSVTLKDYQLVGIHLERCLVIFYASD